MRLIDADALLAAYDSQHEGPPGKARKLIEDAPTVSGWSSVEDGLPETYLSMFSRFHGTNKWSNAMWLMESDTVIVAVRFPDGTRTVTTGSLHDGKWGTKISPVLNPVVTHWMPMPPEPEVIKQ